MDLLTDEERENILRDTRFKYSDCGLGLQHSRKTMFLFVLAGPPQINVAVEKSTHVNIFFFVIATKVDNFRIYFVIFKDLFLLLLFLKVAR